MEKRKTRQKLSWLGIEDEAEVKLAELEATLEENAETEQDNFMKSNSLLSSSAISGHIFLFLLVYKLIPRLYCSK